MAMRLDLTGKEKRSYSILRGIQAAASNDWSRAGQELECSRALHAKNVVDVSAPGRFAIPLDVLEEPIQGARRDLTVGAAAAGGYLVATDNLSFIELLRARSFVFNAGAQRLSDMVGNVTIPRQTASVSTYWLSNESASLTESQPTFGQLALTPKTVGAYTEYSRQLTIQSSPDAEGLVRKDLATAAAMAIDQGVISGNGANGQPTGLLNTSGVGSVAGGTIGYAGILEFQGDVAGSNALSGGSIYVTTPAVAILLKQRQRFATTDSPLWDGNVYEGTVEGFRALSTNLIPASTMIFGDFSQIIVAEWGALVVEVNPFTNFAAGIIGARVMYTVDVGVRYPGAFSIAT